MDKLINGQSFCICDGRIIIAYRQNDGTYIDINEQVYESLLKGET